jgi:cardiolipin synthase
MSDTEWIYYTTPKDAWQGMYEACEKATESIDFEQYIFKLDAVGKRFVELFKRKSEEGVKIRFLCDMVGSWELFFSLERRAMVKGGIDLKFYNNVLPFNSKRSKHCGFFPRDHRKILVVDHDKAFIGGVCFDASMADWRDTHVQVNSGVAKELQETFDAIWNTTCKNECLVEMADYDKRQDSNLVLNVPGNSRAQLRDKVLKALDEAKNRIWITTPYFVPADIVSDRLLSAITRGVDVRIISSGHCNPFTYAIAFNNAGKYLEAGASMYIYTPTMLHTKSIIVDDDFAALGSFNTDNLSFYHNQEADIVTRDVNEVAELRRHYIKDCDVSTELDITTWKNRPYWVKAAAYLARPFKEYL